MSDPTAPPLGPGCNFTTPGTITLANAHSDVTYRVNPLVTPTGLITPQEAAVGPFDDTTELNPVTLTTYTAGSARIEVQFEGEPVTPNSRQACFQLLGAVATTDPQCRSSDGSVVFDNLPLGDYTGYMIDSPAAYLLSEPVAVSVSDQRVVVPTVVVVRRKLDVQATAPDGSPQPGLCYSLSTATPDVTGSFCDLDDGADDGFAHYGAHSAEDVEGGHGLTLQVTSSPPGAGAAPGQGTQTIGPFDSLTEHHVITVATTAVPITGTVRASVTFEGGLALGETACFDLTGPALVGAKSATHDGELMFTDVLAGQYRVRSRADQHPARRVRGCLRGSFCPRPRPSLSGPVRRTSRSRSRSGTWMCWPSMVRG